MRASRLAVYLLPNVLIIWHPLIICCNTDTRGCAYDAAAKHRRPVFFEWYVNERYLAKDAVV
jgi:hypothetical protein